MNQNEIRERIETLKEERKALNLERHIAKLENRLFEMDKDAIQYELSQGFITKKQANSRLAKCRNFYFGTNQ